MAVQEEAILSVCHKEVMNFEVSKILFLGASHINRKFFERCRKEGVGQLFVCNRTLDKAKKWFSPGVNILPWELKSTWQDYDIIVAGTKCPHYLIEKEGAEHLMQEKLLIDLSVPRNVHPELAFHPYIQLWDIDRLQKIAQTLVPSHAEQVYRVEEVISKEVKNYTDRFVQRSVAELRSLPGGYYGS